MKIFPIALSCIAFAVLSGCSSEPSADIQRLYPLSQEQAKASSVVVFEDFSDPLCRHCKTLHAVIEEIKKDFPTVEFKSYMFSFLGPESYRSSIAIECAGLVSNEKRNEMQTLLFASKTPVNNEIRNQFATQIGLPMDSFSACVKDEATKPVIRKTLAEGEKRGVKGTPTIFINGEMYSGPQDKESLTKALNNAVKK